MIDIEARQEIMAHPVTKERTALLMNRLVTRGNHAYHHFMDALKQKCSFIYEDLARAETSELFLTATIVPQNSVELVPFEVFLNKSCRI